MNNVTRNSCAVLQLILILVLAAFGYAPVYAASLTSIDISPPDATVTTSQNQAYTAIGTFSDGSSRVLDSPIAQIAAGGYHSCALLTNGTTKCWGSNFFGEMGNGVTANTSIPTSLQVTDPVAVSGLDTAVAISSGSYYHSCAVLADGQVQCWGNNSNGQLGDGTTTNSSLPVTVNGISTATAVAAGAIHTCALLSSGVVKCWGHNGYGELGNGSTTDWASPASVSGISNAVAISARSYFSCALLSDGTVKCWGNNANGQLGDGTTTNSSTPVTVSGITTATAIAAGNLEHTCALLADGTVQCWGDNSQGQLGDGSTVSSTVPVSVSGITTATTIAGGGAFHTCALLADGQVQCWGGNDFGQLGDGTTTDAHMPVIVSGISNATSIALGTYHSCAQLGDNEVRCWGQNSYGQLGNGITSLSVTPLTVSGITTAAVAVGSFHICALPGDGSVKCWGSNYYGQLGDGSQTNSSSPVTVSGITTATALAAGDGYSCALLADGTIKCWGENIGGELGNGTTTDSTTPVTVSGITTATAIATGYEHACAVLASGQVQCWGDNAYGRLGNGTRTRSLTPVTVSEINTATAITAGSTHSCALLADGTVKCWGGNSKYQLGGIYSLGYATTPVTVSGLGFVTSIAAGAFHTCATMNDGSVMCWGDNTYGENGNSSGVSPVTVDGISNAVAVTAGDEHSCALIGDGSVKCWGYNGDGQLGDYAGVDGTTLGLPPITAGVASTAVMAAAGGLNTCAVLDDASLQCWGGNGFGQLGIDFNYPTPLSVADFHIMQWSSSDPSVASIDANGLASGLSVGSTTLTAAVGTVSANTSLTVIHQTFTLSLPVQGAGSGTVSGAGTYVAGQTATVSATAGSGSTFAGWTGTDSAECATSSVVMNADKTCTVNFVSGTAIPDLIVSALSTTISALQPGHYLYLSNTVTNQGDLKTTAFTVAYHLSPNAVFGDGDDILLNTERSVLSVYPGSSSSASTKLFIPSTTPLGSYYICAMADINNDIAEGNNEGNNASCTVTQVVVSYPDLVLTDVTPATTNINQGDYVSVSTTVLNQGLVMSDSSKVGFSLSMNDMYGDGDDIATIYKHTVASLAANESSTGNTSVRIPSSLAPGNYYLCAKIDYTDIISETNENNNSRCAAFTVPPPDLIVSAVSISVSSATPGSRIYVSNSIMNQGGARADSSIVAFHLSPNATYGDGDDIDTGTTRTVTALPINYTNTRSTRLILPLTTPPGTYHMCIDADSTGVVAESNETNNSACTSTTFTVP